MGPRDPTTKEGLLYRGKNGCRFRTEANREVRFSPVQHNTRTDGVCATLDDPEAMRREKETPLGCIFPAFCRPARFEPVIDKLPEFRRKYKRVQIRLSARPCFNPQLFQEPR